MVSFVLKIIVKIIKDFQIILKYKYLFWLLIVKKIIFETTLKIISEKMPFKKKKKEISNPSNFIHKVK